jgi:hypothetical protein
VDFIGVGAGAVGRSLGRVFLEVQWVGVKREGVLVVWVMRQDLDTWSIEGTYRDAKSV